MDAEFNIPVNTEEGYSPEAIANLDRAVEEFAEDLLKIKPEDANVMVFRTLAITMKGRKRRIGDLGNVNLIFDWSLLLFFTILSVIGIYFGIYLTRFIEGKSLKKGFGWFVLIMAFIILFKEIL